MNNGNQDLESGDWVAVVGGKLTKNNGAELIEPSIKVGKVLFVGKWDVIIQEESWSYPTTFVTKKERCSLIRVKPAYASPSSPETPILGDMVLYYKGIKFGNKEEDVDSHIGILMEISHTPGSRARGKIMVANELIEVELVDIIVLQRKNEKE